MSQAMTGGENTRLIVLISVVATIGGFLFGFDSGVINGTVDGLQQAFGSTKAGLGFEVASMLLGCAIGAFTAGRLADSLGRRNVLIISAVLFLLSAIGAGAATSSVVFVIARVIGGFAVGAASVISPAYIAAVSQHLPEAVLVFDRFHLVKLLNEQLSELRRELYREATDRLQQQVLKGTRWLLLKHPEHLDEQRDERRRLEEALALNQALATAYYLKEDLRQLWERRDEWDAERFLQSWCRRAELSGIRRLQKFAKTLQAHRSGILAWYEYPISTGPLEGVNTKITVLKRQAYGFRNQQYFRLKLYALHLSRHELVG